MHTSVKGKFFIPKSVNMKEKSKKEDKSNVQEVIEEKLVIDKKKVETGKVKLTKRVYEEEVPVDLTTTKENVKVDVKKIGRVVDEPGDAVRQEGDSTVYSVYKEVYVKQTVLEEEVWVTRETTTQKFDKPQTLRREEIIVERSSTNNEKEQPNK